MTPISAYSRLTQSAAKARTADPCAPCPVCKGLECLCRPRFFAGQLLTEEDLNRLETYIVKKNRLHTRFLHGWGVACGLEVVCDPCGNQVIVRPGYAVSPCGDDIIVCRDEAVDTCALISGCCQPETPECEPPRRRPAGCDDRERQWVLSICYDEYPSRKLPSLTASCGCGGKCSGAKSGGSCGCGASQTAAKTSVSKTSKARQPVQCEQALTCESFRFIVTPAPEEKETSGRGALVERFLACLRKLSEGIPPPPAATATVQQLREWCCRVREALLNALASAPVTECSLYEQLSQLCPEPGPGTTPQQYLNQIASTLVPVVIRLFQACLCSALLPPCPDPALDNCVPIATVTVRGSECRVIRICNLEGRKFLTTFPNLQYWLSWLPFARLLRQLLERLCCNPIRVPDTGDLRPGQTFPGFAAAPSKPGAFAAAAASTYSKRNSTAPKGFAAFGLDSLGLTGAGKPYLDNIDLQEPAMSLLFEELASPLLATEIPAGVLGLLNLDDSSTVIEGIREQRTEIENLRATVDEMKTHIQRQELTIDSLVRRLPK